MILKTSLHFVALLLVAPASVIASPNTAYNYYQFELTKAEVKAVESVTEAHCHFGDPAILTCMNKEIVGSEARLNSSYKRTMTRLPKPARVNLRTQQRSWLNTRYDECVLLSEEEDLGAQTAINYNNCVLLELRRRTLWVTKVIPLKAGGIKVYSNWTDPHVDGAKPEAHVTRYLLSRSGQRLYDFKDGRNISKGYWLRCSVVKKH